MVNILVPTDFSELSKIAIRYAIKIATELDGSVTILHVIDLEQKVKATLRLKGSSRELIQTFKKKCQDLVDEVSADLMMEKPISCRVAQGTFGETMRKESKKLKSGLIVMGTRGASGLKKTVLGSNTASLIGESHIPVLAVPEHGDFKSFRNVIYATDLKNLEEELSTLIPYVKRFGSTVHILHIVGNGDNIESAEAKIDTVVRKMGYKNIVTLVTFDPDIDGAIDHYISVSKADLLAMFTHEPSFYEKIFDKSFTRRMAFQSKIPLLAFKTDV
jgi:nucleotide-binding universal stress UspA family protein